MSLHIIFGSMYAGKTTEIIRRIKRYQSINKRVLVINNELDNRYGDGNSIISHDENALKCVKSKTLFENDNKMSLTSEFDVIVIDEAQFFPDLKKYVIKFCEEYKKIVVVAGLISDFKRNKFGNMIDLFYYADDIMHLKSFCSKCKDGQMGIFTSKIDTKTDQIDVGSTDKYIALCRKCYLNHTF